MCGDSNVKINQQTEIDKAHKKKWKPTNAARQHTSKREQAYGGDKNFSMWQEVLSVTGSLHGT